MIQPGADQQPHADAQTSPRRRGVIVGVLAALLLADIVIVLAGSSTPHATLPVATASPTASPLPPTATAAPAPTATPAPDPTVASSPASVFNGTSTPAARPVPTGTPQETGPASQSPHAAFHLSCDATVGQLLSPTIQSRVLATALLVNVYLPPCYDPERYTYPTLYLIQGLGYVSGEWVEDGAPGASNRLMANGRLPPFIIVMPANDSMSGYASRYVYTSRGRGSWEDFIVNELVPWVDARYSTWADRSGRAIGGISRGGYWSLMIGFSHPDMFSVVGGHSPAIDTEYLVGAGPGFSMLSFASSVDALRTLRIYLDAGAGDVTQTGVYKLAAELGQDGITYTGSIGDGVHNDEYWASRIGDYLAFYSADWPRLPRLRTP